MEENKHSIQEFGQELIRAREFKNMTLDQIADSTKISLPYLRAMEEGEWDVLPRPYMEVFLKAYAEAVGMNVPKVMKKYREMVLAQLEVDELPEHEAVEAESEESFEGETLLPAAPKKSIIYAVAGLVILAVIITLLLILIPAKKEENSPPQSVATQTEATTPEPTTTEAQSPPEELTQMKRPAPTTFSLEARARNQCWLLATVDQTDVRDVTLYTDDELTLRAQEEIHLVIGNAGGLELNLAGEILDSLGPEGRPVTLVIGPDGIKSQRLGAWHLNYSGQMQSVPTDSTPENVNP